MQTELQKQSIQEDRRAIATRLSPPEIRPLTGLRAIAAAWVVLFHLEPKLASFFIIHPVASCFFPYNGFLGVDLFFFLSGFVIYYNYAESFRSLRYSSYLKFLWMRFARLYPVHIFALILFVIAIVMRSGSDHPGFYSKRALLCNLLLIHGWSVPLHLSWNGPAWSISCEWLAYLLFPLISVFLIRRSFGFIACFCAMTLLATVLVLQWLQNDGNADYGLIRIAGEFPAGCCLCYLFQKKLGSSLKWGVILFALLIVTPACVFISHKLNLVSYWCLPMLALTVFGLAQQSGLIARILSTRLFVIGGQISYSLYMTHLFGLKLLDHLFPQFENRSWSIVSDFIICIGFAAATFYAIEDPCRKKLRQWGNTISDRRG